MRAGGRGTGREMTSEPAAARFDQRSLMGVSTSIGAAVLVALVCTQLQAPPWVTGPLTAGAGALPAAIEYSRQGRRRNVTDDILRIRQGELRRPVGLVVVMLTPALLLAAEFGAPGSLVAFFSASYASHYLGKHPYRWTVVAAGMAYIIYTIVEATLGIGKSLNGWLLVLDFAYPLTMLIASLAGTWYGRRHHDQFLAKKLARLERKAAKQAAKRQSTLQRFTAQDPFQEIEKLARLRETGALTEEEFQAKKTEILGRI
jgi:Short C-terminal domain